MASKEYSTIDHDKESDELVELQNENAQLNLELCTLHTNYENLESENNTLKEEIASLKEKIKNLEEYIDKIEEDDIVEKTQLNNNDIDILSESMLQSETDVNVLKHKILELQKEIIRLSDNIKEDLINNKNMQNEYESQIEILKNDITALENENDELRQEINDVKEKGQLDIKNCLEEISEIKTEKEQSEQKYMNKLEELNLIIKKYQNKIIEQENAYKALCDTSENKIKETYDKFTEEIKNIKSSQNQLDNMDGYNISDMNLEIHNLKTENFELNKKLENYVLNLTQKQKEFEDINNKYIILYKLEKENKNKIKKLEEENGNLRADLLNNNSDSDKEDNKKIKNEIKDNNTNSKIMKKIMKENEELNKENEKLQKYIISSEFRYSLAMKAIFENKKLKKEINKYKEEIEKINK